MDGDGWDHDAAVEAEVDAILAEFGGDAREAIRALLHDLDALAADYAGTVSRGFVRGGVPVHRRGSGRSHL